MWNMAAGMRGEPKRVHRRWNRRPDHCYRCSNCLGQQSLVREDTLPDEPFLCKLGTYVQYEAIADRKLFS